MNLKKEDHNTPILSWDQLCSTRYHKVHHQDFCSNCGFQDQNLDSYWMCANVYVVFDLSIFDNFFQILILFDILCNLSINILNTFQSNSLHMPSHHLMQLYNLDRMNNLRMKLSSIDFHNLVYSNFSYSMKVSNNLGIDNISHLSKQFL